ncbi:MAG: hypothetical protein JXR37_37645 [Kiritimatiellae bacterium]|nr:hypothetical protein [Kiritimatiellia bacterium]
MRNVSILIIAVATALLSAAPRARAWTAYNDFGWGKGQLDRNITTYSRNQEGRLVDYHTGEQTAATLSLNGGGGGPHEDQGTNATPNTDAHRVFDGFVDCSGAITYGGDNLVIKISGLDPATPYDIVLYGDRNNPAYQTRAKRRVTKVSLSDAESFANISSEGAGFSGETDNSTVITNGYNNRDGFVAWFTDIEPGQDGRVVITVADGGSKDSPRFYVNAMRVQALPEPIAPILFGLMAAVFGLRARRTGRRRDRRTSGPMVRQT